MNYNKLPHPKDAKKILDIAHLKCQGYLYSESRLEKYSLELDDYKLLDETDKYWVIKTDNWNLGSYLNLVFKCDGQDRFGSFEAFDLVELSFSKFFEGNDPRLTVWLARNFLLMSSDKMQAVLSKYCPDVSRLPTKAEMQELTQYLDEKENVDVENSCMDSTYVAVFDYYLGGKLMSVVWADFPSQIETFTWNSDGKIKRHYPEIQCPTCRFGDND